MGHLQQNAAIVGIIFDDQQDFVARFDFSAIILDADFGHGPAFFEVGGVLRGLHRGR